MVIRKDAGLKEGKVIGAMKDAVRLPVMDSLITQDKLLKAFGYERPADLRKCLDSQGVAYFLGKNGKIFTTIQALNAILIGTQTEGNNETFKFD